MRHGREVRQASSMHLSLTQGIHMRWMPRAVAIAAVLSFTIAAAAFAQRRGDGTRAVGTYRAYGASRSVSPRPQQPTAATTGPEWSIFAGIATGDSPYDVGLALGGSGRWRRSDWPVTIRGDGYFAHHGGDIGAPFGGIDVSVNIFGVMGNAEYPFPTTGNIKPYVFGGLGLFYSNVNVDYNGAFEASGYDSATDLGFGIGGGLTLTPRFGVELRFMDIGGFNTIPVLAVLHF